MKRKASLIPFIILGLVATLTCKQWIKGDNTETKPPAGESKSFTLEGKEWSSYDLDGTDIKIEMPNKPKDLTPPLPPSYKAVFSAWHIYSCDEKGFQSSATELIPAGKQKFKIKDLADTSMTAVKKQLSDLTYTLDIRSETNAKINGSFTHNGKPYDLRGCCIYKPTKPARVWAITTLYPRDNTDAQTAGQRIIDSVVFKDSDEECK